MDKEQVTLVAGSVFLIALLYFGFHTKPPKQQLIEKSRAGGIELQETQNVLRDQKAALPDEVRRYVQGLENIVSESSEDSIRTDALKSLSSTWYDRGEYLLAGYFAERIAETEGTAESWAIAGSTYETALSGRQTGNEVTLATSGAERCFENAISLDPQKIEYRINLAICYAEQPPADNPMKGIQLLLELNRSNPDNTAVLYHLARFGMQTGQYAKAEERLRKALSLDPAQQRLHCLMAELMRQTNQLDSARQYQAACDTNKDERTNE